MSPLTIALLFGAGAFLVFMTIFSFVHDREPRVRKGKEDALFSNFYLKVYDALFGTKDPTETAFRMGFNVQDYFQNCKIVEVEPDLKLLIVHRVYMLLFGCVGCACILFAPVVSFPCILLAFYYNNTDQQTLKRKAQEKRRRVFGELPRFLNLLSVQARLLPPEQAVREICTNMDSLLTHEFSMALANSTIGTGSWTDSMKEVASKYNIETLNLTVQSITTAYQKGTYSQFAEQISRLEKDIQQETVLQFKDHAEKTANILALPVLFLELFPVLLLFVIPLFLTLSNIM